MYKKYIFCFALLVFSFNTIKAQGGGDQYLGQILFVSFNYAPKGWADCNGQLLSIAQNQALFSLIGTTYGGNGVNTFALPNIQSRVIISDNTNHPLGSIGGEENHTLSLQELPLHNHVVNAVTTAGNQNSPQNNLLANTKILDKEYSNNTPTATMNVNSVKNEGNSQPHNNMQPFITFKCIISTQGVFPSPN